MSVVNIVHHEYKKIFLSFDKLNLLSISKLKNFHLYLYWKV